MMIRHVIRLAYQQNEYYTHLQRCRTVNNEVFQAFPSDTHADPAHFLASNLDLDLSRMVDENAVIPIRNVKRYAFVGLFTGCPTVLVPYTDTLACTTT